MTAHRIALPVLVYIPEGWPVGQTATICTYDMKQVGHIVHNQLKKTHVMGLITTRLETASLFVGNSNAPYCSITLPANGELEIYDDTGIQGFITHKTFSVLPEMECRDMRDHVFARIKPGLRGAHIIEGDTTVIGRYPGDPPRRPFPGQNVWVFTSEKAGDVDCRLILGTTALELIPEISGD